MQMEGDEVMPKTKKRSSKYMYSYGEMYPGVVIGHKTCMAETQSLATPGHMGWQWNKDLPGFKYRRGWAPGIIGNSVAKVMTFRCPRIGLEKDRRKKKKKKGKGGKGGAGGGRDGAGGKGASGKNDDSEVEELVEPKPTLIVQRKGDVFTIKVNPLKDLTSILPNEDPYVDCDPMVFKIIKKRSPEEQAKMEARRMIRIKKERDAEIRKALSEAVEDICRCAYMDVFCNDLTAIDKVIDKCPAFKEPVCVCAPESLSSLSSNATWDIEYTPPFGCFDLDRKRKCFVHVETQYDITDTGVEPKKPRPPSGCSDGTGKTKKIRMRKPCPLCEKC